MGGDCMVRGGAGAVNQQAMLPQVPDQRQTLVVLPTCGAGLGLQLTCTCESRGLPNGALPLASAPRPPLAPEFHRSAHHSTQTSLAWGA